MEKLLLLSMLAATVTVPAIAARLPRARAALAWTLLLVLASSIFYVLLITRIYTRDYVPEPFQP